MCAGAKNAHHTDTTVACAGPLRECQETLEHRVLFLTKLKDKIRSTGGPTFMMSSDLVKAFVEAGVDMTNLTTDSATLIKQATTLEHVAQKVVAIVVDAASCSQLSVDQLASHHNTIDRMLQHPFMQPMVTETLRNSISKFQAAFSLAEKAVPFYNARMVELKAGKWQTSSMQHAAYSIHSIHATTLA